MPKNVVRHRITVVILSLQRGYNYEMQYWVATRFWGEIFLGVGEYENGGRGVASGDLCVWVSVKRAVLSLFRLL